MPKTTSQLTPLERALRLLGMRARTEVELDRALARGGIARPDRATALARLRELGYMDDGKVAEGRARSLLGRGRSLRFAEQKLRAQGVGQAVAKGAVALAAEGATEASLVAQALARRLRGRPVRDEKERQRLFRSLVQQGHRAQLVAAALKLQEEVVDDAVESDE